MFVRTTYATGDPADLDPVVESLTGEGREMAQRQPGFRGLGVFVDRELGKLLAVSWWETEQARRNSDEEMRARRTEMLERFAATTNVEDYEVAVFHPVHRPQAGAGLRITRLEFDPSDADLLAETFRASVVPRLDTLPGLARASLLLDRRRGRGLTGAVFLDQDSLKASRAGHAAARHEGAAKAHTRVVGLEEFEVVHADIRDDM
jgi:heme-degrading monooxygenase HmoA